MKNLYIVGAGGLGREVLNLVLDIHKMSGQRWNIQGFLDDTEAPLKNKKCDYQVVGTIVDYFPSPNDVLAMAIADPAAKKKISGLLKGRGAKFETLIHPGASLGCNNEFGEGNIFYPGFGMTVNVKIGNFCTLLTCGIGHDVVIGNFCTISSWCNIMGKATLGDGVYMGGNVAVAPRVNIGNGAFICLGSVVIKNVSSHAKILGNPAKEIGEMPKIF